jgi:type IV pilus assembly protein PilM
VDINDRGIILVELRKQDKGYVLQQAVCLPITGDNPSTEIPEALAGAVAGMVAPRTPIVCSLPTNSCLLKVAQLPPAKSDDVAQMIRFEAEAQIPLPLESLNWGFTLEDAATPGMRHAVMAAVRSELVDARLALLAAAGLTPSALQISALAAVRALGVDTQHAGANLIVLLGSEWIDLCMLNDQRICGCRSVRKATDGMMAERLAVEIRQSMGTLTGNGVFARPEQITLVGEDSIEPSLVAALQHALHLPVIVRNPCAGIHQPAVAFASRGVSPGAFAVAIGLAICGLQREFLIDLMPNGLAQQRVAKRHTTWTLAALSFVAVILLVWATMGNAALRGARIDLAALRGQVTDARRTVSRLGPKQVTDSAEVKNLIRSMGNTAADPLELLRKLSEKVPDGVSLTDFSYKGGSAVVLRGQATSNAQVAQLTQGVTDMGVFENTMLDFVNTSTTNTVTAYNFQLTCTLSPEPGAKPAQQNASSTRPGPRTGRIVR